MGLTVLFGLASLLDMGPVFADLDFNRDVRPILSDRCFACHGPDAANQESDFRIDNLDNATIDLGGYAGIVPGDLDASEVHLRIHDEDDPMPPEDFLKKLSERDKAILDEWIESGAQFESHWAFAELPDQIEVPANQSWNDDQTLEPIDSFISFSHAAQELQPSAAAPSEKWLRRVSFDLTGLPPTPTEISEFVKNDSPQKRSETIDRLLASDACAERLTSEWLDVARYSDSYGYQRDDPRYVWPYRDWVIEAFSSNMPYDDFITWQLAGDLLPRATRSQRLATVFNRLHSHKKEGGVAIEEFRVENVADRTHTVASAMMGLTMECCRCHDHKYDPISTKDYYSLSAFFDNVDERGLISFFTDAVPTPAMPLPTDEQQQRIDTAKSELEEAKVLFAKRAELSNQVGFGNWMSGERFVVDPMPGLVANLDFESMEEAKNSFTGNETIEEKPKGDFRSLANHAGDDALTTTANSLVDGRFGQAVKLTGDDAVVLPGAGHFHRHDAFSVSLWIWADDDSKRSVIYRRSRGWDDAGSVGYELTKDGGTLSARLCHFWPGDAIGIEMQDSVLPKQWHHVVVTYDGSSKAAGLNLFLNGVPAKTRIVADNLTRNITNWRNGYNDLAIGSRYRDRGFADGKVDAFKVFDRQLSQLEAKQLFDGKSLYLALSDRDKELSTQSRALLSEYYALAVDPEMRTARSDLRTAAAELNAAVDATTAIGIMRERKTPRQTYVLERGVYDQRGEKVDPSVPGFLPGMSDDLPRNRLGLARWLTSPNHPLTARVAVNRYWQMLFGEGLVRTPEDFGNQGEVPSHPELLDWLARDFVESGWDVHRLLKQMAMSKTYAQSTVVTAETRGKDPENRWLARGVGKRLSAEMIRDNVLATSGLLVNKVGGAPVKPYDVALAYTPLEVDQGEKLYRRSLYTFWKRTSPAPVMMTLNTPTREVCRLKREVTDTPLQALVMMNGDQFVEASHVMAADLVRSFGEDNSAIIIECFIRLTSREPNQKEQQILSKLIVEQQDHFSTNQSDAKELLEVGNAGPSKGEADPARVAAITVLVNMIMNFDESLRHL